MFNRRKAVNINTSKKLKKHKTQGEQNNGNGKRVRNQKADL